MGSLLDAFGMFANYRQQDGRALDIGAEDSLSGSQLYFYQGRYFVHLQTTGSDAVDPAALAECGKAVASRIPDTRKHRPAELAALDRSVIIKGTERYLPQSLLGYDFLNRGLMAEAMLDGSPLQIFLIPGTTSGSAASAFDSYRSQVSGGRVEPSGNGAALMEGVDTIYGPVMILKQGGCLAGALKFSTTKGIRALLESLCR
jgi:hypothetical protein